MQDSYAIGPRATPTVDGARVYVLGGSGLLYCLDSVTGEVQWHKDYVRDFGATLPVWGTTGAPLVVGDRLICLVGGEAGATVVAFDKTTGKPLWKSIPSGSEPGYAQPVLIENANRRQIIIWHPRAVYALDPGNGRILWQQPFKVAMGLTIATPVVSDLRVLVSAFYNGSLMLELERDGTGAGVLWQGKSSSEIDSDGLHALIATPVIDGNFIYGVCSYGQFRCIDACTGARVWETLEVTGEKARWATAMIVRNGDRYFINNDRGELIIARLIPSGYHETSRTRLIKPTSRPGNRRQAGAVNWSHPAYANRRIYARNDEEIIAASLGR
jgi:outer membrane protein assembly factor BamB